MASKRSRRGRRILSFREAAQWDEERIRRFEEEQRRKREWISFVEIAEWCQTHMDAPLCKKLERDR